MNKFYKNKYDKYVQKHKIANSKFKTKTEFGITKFWFEGDSSSYQSMYKLDDIDKFYLTYLPPLISFLNYVTKLDNCLMIGLGGGQIPLYINKKFPETKIDVVEIDPEVIETSKYSGFNHNDNLKIHLQDGNLFINDSMTIYDAIVMDLDDEKSYESFNFENVKKILDVAGILAVNAYSENHNPATSSLLKKINDNFKYIKHYELSHNNILICTNNEIYNLLSSPIKIEAVSTFLLNNKYLYELINAIQSTKYSIKIN